MRIRKRKHDDAHYPAFVRKKNKTPCHPQLFRSCNFCSQQGYLGNDHYCDVFNEERQGYWRDFTESNSSPTPPHSTANQ